MQYQSLDEIFVALKADPKCELLPGATCHILGEGSGKAGVMFVGEAPGADEDKQGRPFVGRSGQILRELIRENGFKEDDVYITNIVKCRPPENRDPLPSEKEAYAPYLDAQIELLKPKLICTLGRHSGAYFIPTLKISSDHGKVMRKKNGQTFMPLYHPAVALYSPSQLETLRYDFRKIPLVLEKLS